MLTMPTGGNESVLMRACQVVGEKGVYKALVDAVDDAGDWTHQQLTKGGSSLTTTWEGDYRPRPCTAPRKTPPRATPPIASTSGTSTPPLLPTISPQLSTQQPPAGGLVNHYTNIAHALSDKALSEKSNGTALPEAPPQGTSVPISATPDTKPRVSQPPTAAPPAPRPPDVFPPEASGRAPTTTPAASAVQPRAAPAEPPPSPPSPPAVAAPPPLPVSLPPEDEWQEERDAAADSPTLPC